MRSWRSTVIAVVLGLTVAAAIVVAAIADHQHKKSVMYRLEEAEWFCEHRGERCGGESSAGVENRWNTRQAAYESALGATLGLTLLVGLRGVTIRRRQRGSRGAEPGGGELRRP